MCVPVCVPEALPADGEVVTLDMDPYLKQHNQPLFAASPHGAKITVKIGTVIFHPCL